LHQPTATEPPLEEVLDELPPTVTAPVLVDVEAVDAVLMP
jgi:hypothetical protein